MVYIFLDGRWVEETFDSIDWDARAPDSGRVKMLSDEDEVVGWLQKRFTLYEDGVITKIYYFEEKAA